MLRTEFAVYAALLSRADAVTRECYPSYETLSAEAGVTRRQVPYALAELIDEHLLRARRSRSVNRYTVLRFPDVRPEIVAEVRGRVFDRLADLGVDAAASVRAVEQQNAPVIAWHQAMTETAAGSDASVAAWQDVYRFDPEGYEVVCAGFDSKSRQIVGARRASD